MMIGFQLSVTAINLESKYDVEIPIISTLLLQMGRITMKLADS